MRHGVIYQSTMLVVAVLPLIAKLGLDLGRKDDSPFGVRSVGAPHRGIGLLAQPHLHAPLIP